MSETPRTDAAVIFYDYRKFVAFNTSVQLETELAAALAANQRLEKERDEAKELAERFRKERHGAMHSSENWELMHAKRHEEVDALKSILGVASRELALTGQRLVDFGSSRKAIDFTLLEIKGVLGAVENHKASLIESTIDERDRLMADVVTLRKALETLIAQCDKTDWMGVAGEMDAELDAAIAALAAEHPGAPLVEAVGKACEALKHAADTFASYVKIHADKHTLEGDAKATANHLAHTECMEALAMIAQFAPKV